MRNLPNIPNFRGNPINLTLPTAQNEITEAKLEALSRHQIEFQINQILQGGNQITPSFKVKKIGEGYLFMKKKPPVANQQTEYEETFLYRNHAPASIFSFVQNNNLPTIHRVKKGSLYSYSEIPYKTNAERDNDQNIINEIGQKLTEKYQEITEIPTSAYQTIQDALDKIDFSQVNIREIDLLLDLSTDLQTYRITREGVANNYSYTFAIRDNNNPLVYHNAFQITQDALKYTIQKADNANFARLSSADPADIQLYYRFRDVLAEVPSATEEQLLINFIKQKRAGHEKDEMVFPVALDRKITITKDGEFKDGDESDFQVLFTKDAQGELVLDQNFTAKQIRDLYDQLFAVTDEKIIYQSTADIIKKTALEEKFEFLVREFPARYSKKESKDGFTVPSYIKSEANNKTEYYFGKNGKLYQKNPGETSDAKANQTQIDNLEKEFSELIGFSSAEIDDLVARVSAIRYKPKDKAEEGFGKDKARKLVFDLLGITKNDNHAFNQAPIEVKDALRGGDFADLRNKIFVEANKVVQPRADQNNPTPDELLEESKNEFRYPHFKFLAANFLEFGLNPTINPPVNSQLRNIQICNFLNDAQAKAHQSAYQKFKPYLENGFFTDFDQAKTSKEEAGFISELEKVVDEKLEITANNKTSTITYDKATNSFKHKDNVVNKYDEDTRKLFLSAIKTARAKKEFEAKQGGFLAIKPVEFFNDLRKEDFEFVLSQDDQTIGNFKVEKFGDLETKLVKDKNNNDKKVVEYNKKYQDGYILYTPNAVNPTHFFGIKFNSENQPEIYRLRKKAVNNERINKALKLNRSEYSETNTVAGDTDILSGFLAAISDEKVSQKNLALKQISTSSPESVRNLLTDINNIRPTDLYLLGLDQSFASTQNQEKRKQTGNKGGVIQEIETKRVSQTYFFSDFDSSKSPDFKQEKIDFYRRHAAKFITLKNDDYTDPQPQNDHLKLQAAIYYFNSIDATIESQRTAVRVFTELSSEKKGEEVDAATQFKTTINPIKLANPIAQYYLGVAYYLGIGVEKNESKAKELFEKSSAAGFKIADKYLDKKLSVDEQIEIRATNFIDKIEERFEANTVKVKEKDKENLAKAIAAQYPQGYRLMAIGYQQGFFGEVNHRLAFENFKEAAKLNDVKALEALAEFDLTLIGDEASLKDELKNELGVAYEEIKKYQAPLVDKLTPKDQAKFNLPASLTVKLIKDAEEFKTQLAIKINNQFENYLVEKKEEEKTDPNDPSKKVKIANFVIYQANRVGAKDLSKPYYVVETEDNNIQGVNANPLGIKKITKKKFINNAQHKADVENAAEETLRLDLIASVIDKESELYNPLNRNLANNKATIAKRLQQRIYNIHQAGAFVNQDIDLTEGYILKYQKNNAGKEVYNLIDPDNANSTLATFPLDFAENPTFVAADDANEFSKIRKADQLLADLSNRLEAEKNDRAQNAKIIENISNGKYGFFTLDAELVKKIEEVERKKAEREKAEAIAKNQVNQPSNQQPSPQANPQGNVAANPPVAAPVAVIVPDPAIQPKPKIGYGILDENQQLLNRGKPFFVVEYDEANSGVGILIDNTPTPAKVEKITKYQNADDVSSAVIYDKNDPNNNTKSEIAARIAADLEINRNAKISPNSPVNTDSTKPIEIVLPANQGQDLIKKLNHALFNSDALPDGVEEQKRYLESKTPFFKGDNGENLFYRVTFGPDLLYPDPEYLLLLYKEKVLLNQFTIKNNLDGTAIIRKFDHSSDPQDLTNSDLENITKLINNIREFELFDYSDHTNYQIVEDEQNKVISKGALYSDNYQDALGNIINESSEFFKLTSELKKTAKMDPDSADEFAQKFFGFTLDEDQNIDSINRSITIQDLYHNANLREREAIDNYARDWIKKNEDKLKSPAYENHAPDLKNQATIFDYNLAGQFHAFGIGVEKNTDLAYQYLSLAAGVKLTGDECEVDEKSTRRIMTNCDNQICFRQNTIIDSWGYQHQINGIDDAKYHLSLLLKENGKNFASDLALSNSLFGEAKSSRKVTAVRKSSYSFAQIDQKINRARDAEKNYNQPQAGNAAVAPAPVSEPKDNSIDSYKVKIAKNKFDIDQLIEIYQKGHFIAGENLLGYVKNYQEYGSNIAEKLKRIKPIISDLIDCETIGKEISVDQKSTSLTNIFNKKADPVKYKVSKAPIGENEDPSFYIIDAETSEGYRLYLNGRLDRMLKDSKGKIQQIRYKNINDFDFNETSDPKKSEPFIEIHAAIKNQTRENQLKGLLTASANIDFKVFEEFKENLVKNLNQTRFKSNQKFESKAEEIFNNLFELNIRDRTISYDFLSTEVERYGDFDRTTFNGLNQETKTLITKFIGENIDKFAQSENPHLLRLAGKFYENNLVEPAVQDNLEAAKACYHKAALKGDAISEAAEKRIDYKQKVKNGFKVLDEKIEGIEANNTFVDQDAKNTAIEEEKNDLKTYLTDNLTAYKKELLRINKSSSKISLAKEFNDLSKDPNKYLSEDQKNIVSVAENADLKKDAENYSIISEFAQNLIDANSDRKVEINNETYFISVEENHTIKITNKDNAGFIINSVLEIDDRVGCYDKNGDYQANSKKQLAQSFSMDDATGDDKIVDLGSLNPKTQQEFDDLLTKIIEKNKELKATIEAAKKQQIDDKTSSLAAPSAAAVNKGKAQNIIHEKPKPIAKTLGWGNLPSLPSMFSKKNPVRSGNTGRNSI